MKHKFVVAMIFSCTILSVIFSLHQSYRYTASQNRLDRYGEWQAVVSNASDTSIETIAQHKNIVMYGIGNICGEIYSPGGTYICTIGTLDSNALELGRLSIQEGALPTAPTEIALEYAALSYLNIPYEIGREISVPVQYTDETGSLQTVSLTFTLSGILTSFAASWEPSAAISGIIPSSCPYFENAQQKKSLFLLGNYDSLSDINELMPLLPDGETLILNKNAYQNSGTAALTFLEQPLIFVMISILLIILVACVAQVQIQEKQHILYIEWVLGRSRADIFWKSIISFLKTTLLSFFIGTPLGLAITWGVGTAFSLFTFHIDPPILGFMLAFELLAVLIGTTLPVISCLKESAEDQKDGVQISRWKRSASMTKGGNLYLFAHGKTLIKWISFIAVTAVICNVITIGIYQRRAYANFMTETGQVDFVWTADVLNSSVSEDSLYMIKNTEGIEMVDYYTPQMQYAALSWDGIERSAYAEIVSGAAMSGDHTLSPMGFLYVIDGTSELAVWLTEQIDDGDCSITDFQDNSTAIVCLPDIITDGSGNYNLYNKTSTWDQSLQVVEEDTLKIGSQIHLEASFKNASVPVAGIIRHLPDSKYSMRPSMCTLGTVFISQNTAEKILQSKNAGVFNTIYAYLEDGADGNVVAKLLSRIRTPGLAFSNHFEAKNAIISEYQTFLLVAAVFLLFVIVLYVLLFFYETQHLVHRERRKIELLLALGIKRSRFIAECVKRAGIISLYCFIPVIMISQAYVYMQPIILELAHGGLISYITSYLIQSIVKLIWVRFPYPFYFILMLLLILTPVCITGFAINREIIKIRTNKANG